MDIVSKLCSNDSTIKYYFKCDYKDLHTIESCLLDLEKHGTVICISSQIGCIQKCSFCACGNLPFGRNLIVDEILNQVKFIINDESSYFEDKFQITFMGSGEPFQNMNNVLTSSSLLFKEYKQLTKINISTVLPEIPKDISVFNEFQDKMHIQYSLHFTDIEKRNKYFNWQLPSINDSITFLDKLSKKINDQYSINYILFDGLNDSDYDAKALVNIIKNSKAYLKISELSPVKNSHFSPSKNKENFLNIIKNADIKYDVFYSKGTDINAGCGQFYNESII